MFGKTVQGIEGRACSTTPWSGSRTAATTWSWRRPTCGPWVATYKEIVRAHTGEDIPGRPYLQMRMAVEAVFSLLERAARRAVTAARSASRPTWGTAVSVARWCSATAGMDSGTRVAFTRDPGTGQQGVYGDYLQNAHGEDVRSRASATPCRCRSSGRIDRPVYDELMHTMRTLEEHYRRPVRHRSFTVERGKLWMLADPRGQAHPGRRVPHQPCSSSTRASSTSTRR
ncbi:hypothetical protein GCM10017559_71910 [Streptosporangium longisporum]|uniref:Transposase DDE domain-containing protein n=1 Tax=Streptosporangium longisporum TaxID=46187 RepID=A0ABP6L687_9ACTN